MNVGLQNFMSRKIKKNQSNLKILTNWYISSYRDKHKNLKKNTFLNKSL